jgi:hypothetical protein
MYTDTSRPNHLAHEVIDNSVDEALSGHAKRIDVVLYKDGSLEVADDGRGMPPAAQISNRSLGLKGMRERVSYHGGTLEAGPATFRANYGEAKLTVEAFDPLFAAFRQFGPQGGAAGPYGDFAVVELRAERGARLPEKSDLICL